MALATYSDLQSAIADWLVRDDLTTRIPDFVTLAEARINRELRCREMVTQATGTIATSTLAVPSDFVEAVMLTLDTVSDAPLEYRPLEDSQLRNAGATSGQPRWYSISGEEFVFFPTPDGSYDYTLTYYAAVPALTDTDNENWLLTKAPDLYLFGALKEANGLLMEGDAEASWDAKYQTTLASIHGSEARSKRTSGPWRSRVLI